MEVAAPQQGPCCEKGAQPIEAKLRQNNRAMIFSAAPITLMKMRALGSERAAMRREALNLPNMRPAGVRRLQDLAAREPGAGDWRGAV